MALIVIRCGSDVSLELPAEATLLDVSAVPTRKELRALDDAAAIALPHDPTPTLDEIAAQPDVRHLGTPELAPQAPHLKDPLRVIVSLKTSLGLPLTVSVMDYCGPYCIEAWPSISTGAVPTAAFVACGSRRTATC